MAARNAKNGVAKVATLFVLLNLCSFLDRSAFSESPALGKASKIVVRNAGVPGENSREGRARFQRDVLDVHPQVVLLYFGMNDAVNEKKMLSGTEYIDNMGWMVEATRKAKALPIVSTIHHVDSVRVLQRHPASVYGREGPNGRIDELNAALRELARTNGMVLVNFEGALDRAGGATPDMSPDGVHFNEAGYALLAKTFYDALPGKLGNVNLIVAMGDSLTYGTPLRTADHTSEGTYPAALERLVNPGMQGPP